MGAVVPALGFMLTFVAGVILVLYVLTYAMHCLLVVVRDTAAGQDEVVWPDEPFLDWAGGALHLVLVVVIVLAPAGVLARSLRETVLPDDPTLRFLLFAVPSFWLLFPAALFSSLSGSSRWFVFRPVVVWNLVRVAPHAFAVYLVSALLAAAVAALGYATLTRSVALAPVAAVGTAAALLVYARLLGRLGWQMGRLPSAKRKPAGKARPPRRRVEVQNPWAAPEEAEQPESEVETTPYGQKRPRVKGYGLAPAEPPREAPTTDEYTAEAPAPVRPAAPVPKRRPRPTATRRHFIAGVLTFPGYAASRKAWLLLSLGFLALFGVAQALAHFYSQLSG